jgi:hypothetical protein
MSDACVLKVFRSLKNTHKKSNHLMFSKKGFVAKAEIPQMPENADSTILFLV